MRDQLSSDHFDRIDVKFGRKSCGSWLDILPKLDVTVLQTSKAMAGKLRENNHHKKRKRRELTEHLNSMSSRLKPNAQGLFVPISNVPSELDAVQDAKTLKMPTTICGYEPQNVDVNHYNN